MEGFPVAKISQQVIAPALEMIRSAAAYAKSIECMNLHDIELHQLHENENNIITETRNA